MGIQEQRAARLAAERLMAPYVQAGTGSLEAQQAILGLLGPEAQQQAYAGIEQGPMFQSLVEQGEAGILANASATGGLRGGNIQASSGSIQTPDASEHDSESISKPCWINFTRSDICRRSGWHMVSRRQETLLTCTVSRVRLRAGAALGQG
jgi:hypothetical protein